MGTDFRYFGLIFIIDIYNLTIVSTDFRYLGLTFIIYNLTIVSTDFRYFGSIFIIDIYNLTIVSTDFRYFGLIFIIYNLTTVSTDFRYFGLIFIIYNLTTVSTDFRYFGLITEKGSRNTCHVFMTDLTSTERFIANFGHSGLTIKSNSGNIGIICIYSLLWLGLNDTPY